MVHASRTKRDDRFPGVKVQAFSANFPAPSCYVRNIISTFSNTFPLLVRFFSRTRVFPGLVARQTRFESVTGKTNTADDATSREICCT